VQAVRGYECEHEQEARETIKWYIHRLRRKVEPDPSAMKNRRTDGEVSGARVRN